MRLRRPVGLAAAFVALAGLGLAAAVTSSLGHVDDPAWRLAARPVDALTPVREGTPGIPCYGDGTTGFRVQAVYAFAADQKDGYAASQAEILDHVGQVERNVEASAAETGGRRRVRWATDPDCKVSVLRIQLPAEGDDSFTNTVEEMRRLGYERFDRAYLIWMDAAVQCGLGSVFNDDRPGMDNANFFGPAWARIDRPCWGLAETHELGHNLGAVQISAAHSDGNIHCLEGYDAMCTGDDLPKALTLNCPDRQHEQLYDCNHDDYFHTDPPDGSYLATHWNAADSPFLARDDPLAVDRRGAFHAIDPVRVVGSAGAGAPVDDDTSVRLIGVGGVPRTGVSAVVATVTIRGATAAGELRLWAVNVGRSEADHEAPLTIRYESAGANSTSTVLALNIHGVVALEATAGAPRVTIDVSGWFGDASGEGGDASLLHPTTPVRLLGSRSGGFVIGEGQYAEVTTEATEAIAKLGATAALVQVTVGQAREPGEVVLWSGAGLVPGATTLAIDPTAPAATLAFVSLGEGGSFSVFNRRGSASVNVDLLGWFGPDRPGRSDGLRFHRARGAGAAEATPLAAGPGDRRPLSVTMPASVPGRGAIAVLAVLHASGTAPNPVVSGTWSGEAVVLAHGVAGAERSTLAVLALDDSAATILSASSQTQVSVHVVGWFG